MNRKGFSKYDRDGRVLYSEYKSEGEIVRHFYKYDENGRRIWYKSEFKDSIFQEYTYYYNNGNSLIISYTIPECIYKKTLIDYNGRIIEESIKNNIGIVMHKIYDHYTNKYKVTKSYDPFKYNIL